MRRFLSNDDAQMSQRTEHEVLRPKRCRMSVEHFEMLLFLCVNKN